MYIHMYVYIYREREINVYVHSIRLSHASVPVYAHMHAQTKPPFGEAPGAALEDYLLRPGLVAGPGAAVSAPRRPLIQTG